MPPRNGPAPAKERNSQLPMLYRPSLPAKLASFGGSGDGAAPIFAVEGIGGDSVTRIKDGRHNVAESMFGIVFREPVAGLLNEPAAEPGRGAGEYDASPRQLYLPHQARIDRLKSRLVRVELAGAPASAKPVLVRSRGSAKGRNRGPMQKTVGGREPGLLSFFRESLGLPLRPDLAVCKRAVVKIHRDCRPSCPPPIFFHLLPQQISRRGIRSLGKGEVL